MIFRCRYPLFLLFYLLSKTQPTITPQVLFIKKVNTYYLNGLFLNNNRIAIPQFINNSHKKNCFQAIKTMQKSKKRAKIFIKKTLCKKEELHPAIKNSVLRSATKRISVVNVIGDSLFWRFVEVSRDYKFTQTRACKLAVTWPHDFRKQLKQTISNHIYDGDNTLVDLRRTKLRKSFLSHWNFLKSLFYMSI